MRDLSPFESRGRTLRKLGALALLVVAGVAVVSVALAGNTKPTGAGKAPLVNSIPFTCPTGAPPGGPEFGFVVLNTNRNGDLIVEVSVKNGTPNQTYSIFVNQDPGDCPTTPTGTLTTNEKGNGNGHVVETRVPAAANFWVSAVGGGQVLRSPAVQLD